MAAEIVGRLSPNHEPQIIEEGQEPDDFWNAIGGKGDYDKELDKPGPPFLEARLFHCKILANGRFRVEEVHHYEQEDMDVDDIMVLDGGDEIYVWEGDGSTEEEKAKSLEMANVIRKHIKALKRINKFKKKIATFTAIYPDRSISSFRRNRSNNKNSSRPRTAFI